MHQIEIDHIEVTDTTIGLKYWKSGNSHKQNIVFDLADFENWLKANRNISVMKYWEHWDQVTDEMATTILHRDMMHFLADKLGHFTGYQTVADLSRKPMTRVSNLGQTDAAESESA